MALERTRLIASKSDHHSHLQHTHPNMYRRFSSSGIYGLSFDGLVDHVWDSAFDDAKETLRKPYDVLMTTALVTDGGWGGCGPTGVLARGLGLAAVRVVRDNIY